MKIFNQAIPDAAPSDIIQWLDSSGIRVDGHSFDSARSPQLIEPIRSMRDAETRIGTLIKPVQSGGSTAGEVVMAFWAVFFYGLIQFNWDSDLHAKERWERRIRKIFTSLKHIIRWPGERFDETICCARLLNSTVYVQGVQAPGSLDSETIPLQINEEVHLWGPGMLDKARRRQTLVWNSKAFDISNASNDGDQLHAAYEEGTMEIWETFCPGCKGYHAMRFRFDDKKPELGGLRFDTNAGRTDSGKYNFNKLVPTIRYQMPCGFVMNDTAKERRQPGRYRATNAGALSYKRSWTYEGVSVPEIKWPELVSEWLKACRAAKAGDLEPMRRFVTERECRFWKDDLIPFRGQIIVNDTVTKNRDGLPNRVARFATADWQQGQKVLGQLTHYWLVIEDVMENCNSQIVFEGMISTDEELIATLDEFNVPHSACFIDASKNTKSILSFCYREGINAVSGIISHRGSFRHADGVKRFYSEEKTICSELNMPPKCDPVYTQDGAIPSPQEPIIISYNKAGLLANHFFIRDMKATVLRNNPKAMPDDYIERVIPGDVSEDFKQQNEAWERVSQKQTKTNDDVEGFRKIRRDDHLFMCLAYIDMLKEWSGLLGDQLARMGIRKPQNETEK